MITLKNTVRLLVLLVTLSSMAIVHAQDFSNSGVNRLLRLNEAPDGVVFELISWDDKTWQWASPMIASLRNQLKTKFPDIDVTIVSHGAEQFQLTRQKQAEQAQAIAQLGDLVEQGVSLHVCGTHSEWKGVDESSYIDIADVAASGPAQINDYIKLGYKHILLKKPL